MGSMASYHASECFMTADDSLSSPEYSSIGENMALTITLTTEVDYVNFTELVEYWFSQYKHYISTDNTCTSVCDQFVQVLTSYMYASIIVGHDYH